MKCEEGKEEEGEEEKGEGGGEGGSGARTAKMSLAGCAAVVVGILAFLGE
jgi:hypothetical protein